MILDRLLEGLHKSRELIMTQLEIVPFAIVIVILTVILAWLIRRAFSRFISRTTGDLKIDSTNYLFLSHLIVAVIYITGISFALHLFPFMRHISSSLLAGAGILAVAVGFASQQALGNIVSGIFIVIFKPYRIGDRITLKIDMRGVVEDINLRHTIVRNLENQRIIIPNAVISNEILVNSNYSDVRICRFVEIGISYQSDVDRAKEIMNEEVLAHPGYLDVRTQADMEKGIPPVTIRLISLNDSSVTLRAWVWAADAFAAFAMSCDLLESIKKRFDQEGIVIPFPQRTISYLTPKNSIEE